jgi:excisionase family DNA binding protein
MATPARRTTSNGGVESQLGLFRVLDRPEFVADASSDPDRRYGGRTLPRLCVKPDEAAAMLGVSRDYFDEHVKPELRIIRRGRRILIALAELDRWLDRAAARPLRAQ